MKELFESSFINVISEENDELRKEIARLNKIIDKIEEFIQLKIIRSENESDYIIDEGDIKELYYKLKELKEKGEK